jgi:hypothetical protein
VRKLGSLAAATILALAGCGLDSWPYLDPPGLPEWTASDLREEFQIKNVATAVPEFRGFELYYKFHTESQVRETTIKTREALVSAQFRRVYADTDTLDAFNPPVIKVAIGDRNTNFDTVAFFTPDNDPANPPFADYDYISGVPVADIALRRAVKDFGVLKEFDLGSLAVTDEDIAAIWTEAQTDGYVYLVLYAISYGLKDFSTPLYSEAQYLGFMRYNF